MATLLQTALERNNYELAALILVYGLLKAMKNEQERQEKRQKTRFLRSRPR
jgi:hypothetical protein